MKKTNLKHLVKHFFVLTAILISFPNLCFSQTLPPRTPSSFNIKQLHCGHSLTSPLFGPWPGQFVELVADSNGKQGWEIFGTMIGAADLPGAWLKAHWSQVLNWNNKPRDSFYMPNSDPRHHINKWELMVVTENFEGPLNFGLNQSEKYLDSFVKNTWQNGNSGNGAPIMLWTNWPALDGTTYFADFKKYGFSENATTYTAFRQLLDSLEFRGVNGKGGWIRMQDNANVNRPSGAPPVYIIPGNRMMARFYDDVKVGKVPTITNMNQILPDGVHPNHIGAYMVSLIHYTCIFGKSPVGLSNQLHSGAPAIDPLLAAYIQNMIWDVASKYPRAGLVNNQGTAIDNIKTVDFTVFPNPANSIINISNVNENTSTEIFRSTGQLILKSNLKTIDVSAFPKGIYIIKTDNLSKKLIIY